MPIRPFLLPGPILSKTTSTNFCRSLLDNLHRLPLNVRSSPVRISFRSRIHGCQLPVRLSFPSHLTYVVLWSTQPFVHESTKLSWSRFPTCSVLHRFSLPLLFSSAHCLSYKGLVYRYTLPSSLIALQFLCRSSDPSRSTGCACLTGNWCT